MGQLDFYLGSPEWVNWLHGSLWPPQFKLNSPTCVRDWFLNKKFKKPNTWNIMAEVEQSMKGIHLTIAWPLNCKWSLKAQRLWSSANVNLHNDKVWIVGSKLLKWESRFPLASINTTTTKKTSVFYRGYQCNLSWFEEKNVYCGNLETKILWHKPIFMPNTEILLLFKIT